MKCKQWSDKIITVLFIIILQTVVIFKDLREKKKKKRDVGCVWIHDLKWACNEWKNERENVNVLGAFKDPSLVSKIEQFKSKIFYFYSKI